MILFENILARWREWRRKPRHLTYVAVRPWWGSHDPGD